MFAIIIIVALVAAISTVVVAINKDVKNGDVFVTNNLKLVRVAEESHNLCSEETDYSKQETNLYCEEFTNMDWVKLKEAVNDIVSYDDIINHNESAIANARRIIQEAFAESDVCRKKALDLIKSNCHLSPIYGIDKNANLVVIDHYHRVTPKTIATNDSTKPNYNLSAREIFEKGDID